MSAALIPLAFVLALLLALYFTPLAREAALRFGIVDRPDGRLKQQATPVPYLGGLAVFLAYLVALGMVFAFDTLLLGLLLAGTLTLLVGLVDDFGVLTPAAKLAGQAVAVFVLLRSGAVIELAQVPQGLRWPLAGLWLFAVCNAFNLLDIMDGLAAGVGTVAAVAFGVVALSTGEYPEAAASFALAGALAGFLVFNFQPARIYLGDAGSLAVGITLGALALAIRWSERSAAGFLAPLAILAVPLADTAYVSVLRARAGRPFWHGSPDHFPLRLHRMLDGSVRRTVSCGPRSLRPRRDGGGGERCALAVGGRALDPRRVRPRLRSPAPHPGPGADGDPAVRRVVVLGAGLTGLSAAYHLRQRGVDAEILEKDERPGGACRTVERDGFFFDLTGHLLHLARAESQGLLASLGVARALRAHRRRAGVALAGTVTPYPIQIHTYRLPREVRRDCLLGFVEARMRPEDRTGERATFADWVMSPLR